MADVDAQIDDLLARFDAAVADDQRQPALRAAEDAGQLALDHRRHARAADIFTRLGGFHRRHRDRQSALACFENALLATRLVLGEAHDPRWREWIDDPKLYGRGRLPTAADGDDAPVDPPRAATGDDHRLVVDLLIAIASLYLEMSQDPLARERLRHAIERAAAHDLPRREARARIVLAAVERRADRPAEAAAHLERALALLGPDGPIDARVEAHAGRAALALAAGDRAAAEADLRAALALAPPPAGTPPSAPRPPITPGAAAVALMLGELLADAPDDARRAEAERLLTAALDDPDTRWRARAHLGRLAVDRPAAAADHLDAALAGAGAAVRTWRTDEARVTLGDAIEPLRVEAVRAALAAGRVERALELTEDGRAAAFLAMRATARAFAPEHNSPVQSTRSNPLRDDGRVRLSPVDRPAPLPRVVFAAHPDETLAFIARPGEPPRVHRLPLGRAELAERIDRLRAELGVERARGDRFGAARAARRGAAGPAHLAALAAALLHPIEPDLPLDPETPLVLEPDGPLWALPFAALPTAAGPPLGLARPLLLAPSAHLLDDLRRLGPALANGPPLVVGDPAMPAGDPPLAPLPGAAAEARAVAAALGVTALTGPAATVPAVEAAAENAPLIHLATHGAAAADPRDAWLALADDGLTSGYWRTGHILSTRLVAELVVLSACQTALGTVTADGVIGLARAFLVAGARAVLVSAWRVDDAATAELMRAFYAARADAPTTAHALRDAMRRVHAALGPDPDPALWAAFALVGAEAPAPRPISPPLPPAGKFSR